MVDTYAAGQHTTAALRAAQFDTNDRSSQARRDAEAWRHDASDAARRRLRAAAALSLELALLQLDAPGGPASAIAIGEATVRALERTSSNDAAFCAVWRLAHLHVLLFAREVDDPEGRTRRDDVAHLPAALQAEWHMTRGIAFETNARLSPGRPQVQQTPFGRTVLPRQPVMERNLRSARAHYEAALAADDTHLETRVRLGRVLLELDEPEPARDHLERAATDRCLDVVCGLGWLFLGEWHMLHGTPAAARDAYVRASSVLELRQSALLGLLAATMQTRPDQAIELTHQFDAEAMLAGRPEPDAWSRYVAGHPFGVATVMRAMREGVGQ